MENLSKDKTLKSEQLIDLSFALGKAYEDIGNYEKSFENLEKGNKLKKQGLYNEAIKVYQEGRKLEPKNVSLLFELSEAYANVNELETAIALIDTAISINPNYPEFYNNRGLLYYKIKKDKEAIKNYKQGIKLDSTQWSFYANLAMVYYYQDSFKTACENIEKAESLGLEITDFDLLREIKNEYCE